MRQKEDLIRDNCVGLRQFRLSSSYVACRKAFGLTGPSSPARRSEMLLSRNSSFRNFPSRSRSLRGAAKVHEVKLDGYRMAADPRAGLDWTAKYPSVIAPYAPGNRGAKFPRFGNPHS